MKPVQLDSLRRRKTAWDKEVFLLTGNGEFRGGKEGRKERKKRVVWPQIALTGLA